MKNTIYILLLFMLLSCSKDDASPAEATQLEANTWILTGIKSATDPSIGPSDIEYCKEEVWSFATGRASTSPNGYGCYYSDFLGNTNYQTKGAKIIFSANGFDDPDASAAMSFKENTMQWHFSEKENMFELTLTFTKASAVSVNQQGGSNQQGSSTSFPADGIKNGLIAYYPFTGNANDESGNKNHGIKEGGVSLTSDRYNKANQAYQFKDAAYIKVPNSSSLKLNNAFTYSVWVKMISTSGYDGYGSLTTTGNAHTILSKDCDASTFSSSVSVNQDGTFNYGGGRWYNDFHTPIAFKTSQWTHLSLVYDGQRIKLYVNGNSAGSKEATIDFAETNASDLYLGYMGCFYYFFNGALDDFRLYNRALSDAEMKKIFDAEKP